MKKNKSLLLKLMTYNLKLTTAIFQKRDTVKLTAAIEHRTLWGTSEQLLLEN